MNVGVGPLTLQVGSMDPRAAVTVIVSSSQPAPTDQGSILRATDPARQFSAGTIWVRSMGMAVDLDVVPGALAVSVVGAGEAPAASGEMTTIVDSTGTPGYTYICKASPGTSAAVTGWQICRIDSTGSKLWAGGSAAFDKIAANRAGYSYS